jgi:DNA-binding PadR family transcriptional regulator
MWYELFILLQLMRGPAHGYLITKIIKDIIGPYATLSHGRLYPLLARLEQQGMIQAVSGGSSQHGDRQSRVYEITEPGRQRFHQLMLDTTSKLGEYRQIFAHKVSGFEFLTPAERLYLTEHYCSYCEAHITHLYTEIEDLLSSIASKAKRWPPERLDDTLNVISHWIEQWKLELQWGEQLRERIFQEQQQQEQAEAAPAS